MITREDSGERLQASKSVRKRPKIKLSMRETLTYEDRHDMFIVGAKALLYIDIKA
jgi:hypothetical protein